LGKKNVKPFLLGKKGPRIKYQGFVEWVLIPEPLMETLKVKKEGKN